MPRSGHAWFAFLIGLFILLFSSVPLIFGLWSYTWQQADGVVTYSKPYSFGHSSHVDIRYKYNYRGQEYSGDRYRFHFIIDRPDGSQVNNIQARYPVGEKVRVAVNPWRPAQSVLQAGVEWMDFVWPPVSLLFFIAASRMDRKQQPAEQQVRKRRFSTATVLFLIGTGLILYGGNTLATAWRSSSWPTTEGKITYSALRSEGAPGLWYEYRVQGTRYVAEFYRVGGNATPFASVAKAASERYPEGRAVKVYYNPNDPSEAVLEPGVWYGNFIFPVVGIGLLLAAWVAKKLTAVLAARGK